MPTGVFQLNPYKIKIPSGVTVEAHWENLITEYMVDQGYIVQHDCRIRHKKQIEKCICEDKSKWPKDKKIQICHVGHYWFINEEDSNIFIKCAECKKIQGIIETAAQVAWQNKAHPPKPHYKKDEEISNKLRNVKKDAAGQLEMKKAELLSLMITQKQKPLFDEMISILKEIRDA